MTDDILVQTVHTGKILVRVMSCNFLQTPVTKS